jgi:hypothetical protein
MCKHRAPLERIIKRNQIYKHCAPPEHLRRDRITVLRNISTAVLSMFSLTGLTAFANVAALASDIVSDFDATLLV